MNHAELCNDLAVAKSTGYVECTLGPVFTAPFGATPQRADVLRIRPSYTNFFVEIYEVKATRADFLSDIRSGKWRGYLPSCHRLYFATQKGIAQKSDIPENAGWIVRSDNGWYTRIAAPTREVDIPLELYQSLLFYGHDALVERVMRSRLDKEITRAIGWLRAGYESRWTKRVREMPR